MFLQKISTAYTMYFNAKNERSGGLFQGKFKSQHANADRYLKYLFSYIHMNPLKLYQPDWREAGVKDIAAADLYLKSYPYSSYIDYSGGTRHEGEIIERSAFPDYFQGLSDATEEVRSWISP